MQQLGCCGTFFIKLQIRRYGGMKKGIHPPLYDAVIKCSCGNVIHTKATVKEIHVEICSKCHPFYTGKQKLVDTAGMVEKFRRRYAKAQQLKR